MPKTTNNLCWWVVTSGLCSALLFSQPGCAGEHGPAAGQAQQFQPDSLRNTFPFAAAGLPYHVYLCGVGLPDRLPAREARAAIEAAFERQGVALERDYRFDYGAVSMHLDGYNAGLRLGYVFIPARRLAPDAVGGFFSNRGQARRSHEALEQLKIALASPPSALAWEQIFVYRVDENWLRRPRAIWKIRSAEIREARLRGVLFTQLLRDLLPWNSLPDWYRHMIERTLALPEGPDRQKALERCIAVYDWVFNYELTDRQLTDALFLAAEQLLRRPEGTILTGEIEQIHRIATYRARYSPEPDRSPAGDSLWIRDVARHRRRVLDLLGASWPGLLPTMALLDGEADQYFISLDEVRALDSLAGRGEVFIAPISVYDRRCAYRYDSTRADYREAERRAYQSNDPVEVGVFEREVRGKTLQVRLGRLGEAVERYIAWARRGK
jgi:hypothetical protein